MSAWKSERLGDLLLKTTTVDPTKTPNDLFSYIDVSSVSNVSFAVEDTQELLGKNAPGRARRLVAAGDVIFATVRPTLQRVAIIPERLNRAVCSTGYFVMRVGARLDRSYLFYWLLSEAFRSAMERRQRGTSYPAVTDGDIREQSIPLPPIEEQRRIVAVLDEAFAAIATATANAKKNLANARELFEATLRDALDDGVSPWTTLGQATDIKVGFAFKSTGYSSSDDDIPLIRGDNVVQGRLRWEDVKRWPRLAADDYTAYSLAQGDVLLAMDRTWVKAGLKYAVIGPDDVPSLLVQRVARLRPRDATSSKFIALQIAAPVFTEYVLGIQTGLGVPHISGKQIADYRFRLPPRTKQLELIERLSAVRRASSQLAHGYAARLKALQSLREALLNRAFSGELTEREPLAA